MAAVAKAARLRRVRSVRARQNLVILLPLFTLLAFRLAARASEPPLPWEPALDAAGFLIVAAGLWIRLSARQWKAERSHAELVTDGIYAWIRHPLYLGSFLLGTGICAILGDVWFAAVFFGVFWVSHLRVIHREEAELEGVFGDAYREYRKQTPSLLPKRLLPPGGGVPSRLWEGVVREGDALCAGLALPLLIWLAEWLVRHGEAARSPASTWPAALLLLGIAALAVLWLRLKLDYRVLIRRERRRSLSLAGEPGSHPGPSYSGRPRG